MTRTPALLAETPTDSDSGKDPFALQRDAFSDVLELVRVRGNTVFTCAVDSPFAVYFPAEKHRLHIVRSGNISIAVDGTDELFQASQGDLVMLVHGHGHTIFDASKDEGVSIDHLATTIYNRQTLTLGEGKTVWMCGDFGFDSHLAQRLLALLPPVIVLRGLRDRPYEWLELSCHFIMDEALNPRAGGAAMISRLLDVIFMQLLRTWAAEGNVGRGWLSGAIDPRINQAMSAMHADPARSWSVAELASLANLSRSAFAERFGTIVGQSPLHYLTTWRLDRAAELLRHGRAPISEISLRVGYRSESAFSRAFKSRFGVSPLHWRRL